MTDRSLSKLKLTAAAAALLVSAAARAQHDHGHSHDHSAAHATVKAEIVSPKSFAAGKTAATVLRLTSKDGKPIIPDDLREVHTEKLHLLIVDEALNDYHHEHPVPGQKPGEYSFEFSPRVGGTYSIWADIMPTATGAQEYVKTEVKVQGSPPGKDKTINTTAEASGYRFSLTTENNEPLQAGKATLVKIKVTTADGKEFTQLEPVMGAFAHMVAFPEALDSVTHVHPMGREPEQATERGGPELTFHVQPEKAGFQKLFLQTQIDGKEVYAAFAQNVQPGSTASAAKSASAEYICPMHPEVTQKTPGKCPKCGMALEPKKAHDDEHAHTH